MLDLDKAYGLSEINILGDYADFNGVKLHAKLPQEMTVKQTIKDEIYQVCKRLEELRKRHPNTKINYIEGNHEYRLVRFIVSKAPELFDVIRLPELLLFERYGINHVPYTPNQLYAICGSNLYARHEPFSMGKNCASTSLSKAHISLIFGHTHRRQSYTERDPHGRLLTCHSSGWLGDATQPVFQFVNGPPTWSHAINVAWIWGKDKWIIQEIPIVRHKAIFNGIQYG